MKSVRVWLFLICIPFCARVQAQNQPADEPGLPPEIELEELRLVVRTLAEENRMLKAKLAALEASRTAQEPNRASAEPTANLPPSLSGQPPEKDTPAEPARILYVNPTWHYIVVDRGSSVGVQPNQKLSIVRNGVLIAHGTVTEVKPEQSVAEIDVQSVGSGGLYPKIGDRIQAR